MENTDGKFDQPGNSPVDCDEKQELVIDEKCLAGDTATSNLFLKENEETSSVLQQVKVLQQVRVLQQVKVYPLFDPF